VAHFKKNELRPHLKRQWCIGILTSDFIWRMEQVLDLYEQPYDFQQPVVCFDERPCQLLGDILMPIPMKPGQPQRQDYQYTRYGSCCVLLAFEPLRGRRFIQVRQRRTKADYAHFMLELRTEIYPEAKKIILIQDNLNTHTPGAFYETFDVHTAFRLSRDIEMVYTPKKGSWLNMAEIEFSALAKQCLDRRIAKIDTLRAQVMIWTQDRNRNNITVQWQFSKNNARDKFDRFYRSIQN
jgi:hypothetical protein